MTEIILTKTIKLHPEHGLYCNTIWEVVENTEVHPGSVVRWWVIGKSGKIVGILEHEAEEI